MREINILTEDIKELDKDNKIGIDTVDKIHLELGRRLCKYSFGLFFIFILVPLLFGLITHIHFGFYLLIYIIIMFDLGFWILKNYEKETLGSDDRKPIYTPIILLPFEYLKYLKFLFSK
jgi:positive regulator of sigma E activity